MTPKRDFSQDIPNNPFSSPEVHALKGPYWNMPIGDGLEVDNFGSVQTDGATPSDPSAYLYGPNGMVGVGTNLLISEDGEFVVD